MFEVSVRTGFSAAHRLEGYPGSCATLHGHNWDVEVFLRGEELNSTGILADFRELKETVSRALEAIDHSDLNVFEAFKASNPTSENIAQFLFRELSAGLNCDEYRVHRVSVNETPETCATYWEGAGTGNG